MKPKAKPDGAPLKVGDLVTTSYWPERSDAVRKIMAVFASPDSESGQSAIASEGDRCAACGHSDGGTKTPLLDSGWFKRVKK